MGANPPAGAITPVTVAAIAIGFMCDGPSGDILLFVRSHAGVSPGSPAATALVRVAKHSGTSAPSSTGALG